MTLLSSVAGCPNSHNHPLMNPHPHMDSHPLPLVPLRPCLAFPAFITRLETGLSNDGIIHTDEGGLDVFPRKYRDLPPELGGMGANFYPATTQAFLQDQGGNVRVSALSKQPHGVAGNQQPGSLEVMLHR